MSIIKMKKIKLNEKDLELRKILLKKAIKRNDKMWEEDLRKQIKNKKIPVKENIKGFKF